MKLIDYRKTVRKVTRRVAADELGVTQGTLFRWEVQGRVPEADDIRKITTWSGGQVTANDMVYPDGLPA